MKHLSALLIAIALLATASPAVASQPSFAVSPHVGLTAHQPFGDLGSWATFGADAGVILPFDVGSMERPLQLGVDVYYTQPGATGDGHHPMLGDADSDGANYDWELTQRMLTLQFTPMWRFMTPGEGLGVHALIGPRIYLMESIMEASGNDSDFGENRETNTEFGFVVGAGVEYELGPGSLHSTLTLGASPLDQRITGETNASALNLAAGYRFFF